MLSALPVPVWCGWSPALPQKYSQSCQKTFTRESLGYIPGFEFDLPAERGTKECTLPFLCYISSEVTFIGGRKT